MLSFHPWNNAIAAMDLWQVINGLVLHQWLDLVRNVCSQGVMATYLQMPSKPVHPDETCTKTVLGVADAFGSTSQHISPGLWKVLNNMEADKITSVVRNDFGNLQLAQSYFKLHGHKPTRHKYIRQELKEVGRLLLILMEKESIYSFEDAVHPTNYSN